MTVSTGDWSDALAGALTMMVVAVGPEVTSKVLDDTFDCACRQADKKRRPDGLGRLRDLIEDNVGLEATHHKIVALKVTEAPAATVEALVFQLRSGVDALSNPSTLARLARLSEQQARSVAERVRNFKANIASAWGLDEVEALLTIWSLRHGG
jgi:hypothetical protein